MKIKLIFTVLALFAGITLFSQKQEKIYYDENWKGCSQSEAKYYRIVIYGENGKITGKIKDYFITGELQAEIDGAISIDKYVDSKSKFTGYSIAYYKNGTKSHETYHNDDGSVKYGKSWYENGKIESEWNDKESIYYYKSGKLYRKFTSSDMFFIECDEFDKCQKVFWDNFYSKDNPNNWNLVNSYDYESKIIAEKGLLVKNKTDRGLMQAINVPLNLTDNFSIETIVEFKDGETNNAHALMWGFKDWENFNYFGISANGQYLIQTMEEGIYIPVEDWTQTNAVNRNAQRNLLKILRRNDKLFFSINGQLVHSSDFYDFKSNNVGFLVYGKKEVLFEYLLIKQDISDNSYEGASSATSNAGWKGSGSGFFVDYRGYIATNYHVVENATDIQVEFIRNGQTQTFKAEVVQTDKQNDLAIIKISENSFDPFTKLPYNFKQTISDVGTTVFTLGYPLTQIMGNEVKFTDGKISSKTGFQGDITSYQITVPIQPGNSGGPLFDYDGNLVGITAAGLNKSVADNVNYAIKST
jgi:S1-C subfamily serine protease